MCTFGIDELRQHPTEILLLWRHAEEHALGAHLAVESLDIGNSEAQFDFSRWILVGSRVQGEGRFARNELTPTGRLELQRETENIAVELHGPVHIQATAQIPATADTVWHEIGSFQGVGRWHPMLTKVDGEGKQPGSIRMPESGDGQKNVERLREINPAQHFMRYEILSSPMPIKDYIAELRVADNGDGTSTVVWGGDFQVTSGDERKTVERIQGFLTAGLENLQKKHR